MKSARYFVPLMMFAVLVYFLYTGLSLDPSKRESTLLGKPAPMFNLAKVLNPEEKLSPEQMKGKVSLINVWASWCVSCRQEHSLLMRLLSQKNIADRMGLYGINWKDTLPKAQAWLKQGGNPYIATAFDPSGRTGIDYGVTGTPETFILDKQGIVRYKHVGPINIDVFSQVLWPVIETLDKEKFINEKTS